MAGPFPGMDPWLERPAVFGGVHTRLIWRASEALQGQLGERYYVEIGERVYIEQPAPQQSFWPDVSVVETPGPGAARLEEAAGATVADAPSVVLIGAAPAERREPFIEIRDAVHGQAVVTVIEVLSPTNKTGEGRHVYLRKQRELLRSGTHLVEIDLLRAGDHTVACPREGLPASAYRVVASPADEEHSRFEVWAFGVRDRLPRIAVPLAGDDPRVALDLGEVLDRVYESGTYARRIDYDEPPVPPLADADAAWARAEIASWRQRPSA